MRIEEAIPRLVRIPLKTPYTIAHHTFSDVELVYLELRLSNGLVGYGAASPAEEVTGETAAEVYRNLQSLLPEMVIGMHIRDFHHILERVEKECPRAPALRAAIDMAFHDAYCRWINKPLVEYLGRKLGDLPTSVTIGIMKEDEAIATAREYVKMGFRALKIKTGMDVDADISLMQRLRKIFGDRITLRADANRGYRLPQLRSFLESTADLNVELVEQPLSEWEDADLKTLPAQWRQLLMADESLHDLEAARRLILHPQPFGVFNIKLMKCGGIASAIRIADMANQGRLSVFWGCNDESVCSIAAALHVAYATPNTHFLDLDGSFELAEDLLAGGFILEDGLMKITPGPGLGVYPFGI